MNHRVFLISTLPIPLYVCGQVPTVKNENLDYVQVTKAVTFCFVPGESGGLQPDIRGLPGQLAADSMTLRAISSEPMPSVVRSWYNTVIRQDEESKSPIQRATVPLPDISDLTKGR